VVKQIEEVIMEGRKNLLIHQQKGGIMEIKMRKKKVTKSTDVYEPIMKDDDDAPAPLSTLYLYKWWSRGVEEVTIILKKGEE